MFDFMNEDWFVIALEIVFLLFIAYDWKKYQETKKREYITNIMLAIVFAIWTLLPFYNSYITWTDADKKMLINTCLKENNETLCSCLSDTTFKEYAFSDYKNLDKESEEFKEFIKDTKEECLDDSWF